MVKTTITETTKKYDKDGKLVEEITRSETTEDDTIYFDYDKFNNPTNPNVDCKTESKTA